jgi:hypothetical protein
MAYKPTKEDTTKNNPLKKLLACLGPISKAPDLPQATKLALNKIIAIIHNMKVDTPEKAHVLAGSIVVLLFHLKDRGLDLMEAKNKKFEKLCMEIKPAALYLSDSVRADFYGEKPQSISTPQKPSIKRTV